MIELLIETGLASGRGDARRLIEGGGIYVNDVALPESRELTDADLLHGRYVMLRKGKRNRHLLVAGELPRERARPRLRPRPRRPRPRRGCGPSSRAGGRPRDPSARR